MNCVRLAQEAQLRAVVLGELDEVRLQGFGRLFDELFVVDDTCGHGPLNPISLFADEGPNGSIWTPRVTVVIFIRPLHDGINLSRRQVVEAELLQRPLELVAVHGAVAVEIGQFEELLERQAAERTIRRVDKGLDDLRVRADDAAAERQEPLLAHEALREPHDRRKYAVFCGTHHDRRLERRRAANGSSDAEIWSRRER